MTTQWTEDDDGEPLGADVRRYLDEAITQWRRIASDPGHQHNSIARYYVDAYQSARISLLGSALP